MSTSTTTSKRRAPFTSYVAMIGVGIVASGVLAALAALLRDDHQLLAAIVFFTTTLPVSLSLGWVLFVSSHVVERDLRAEDNVENRWFEVAASHTALDTFVALGIGSALFAFAGDQLQLDVSTVLIAIMALLGADFAVRYAVQRRRATGDADA